MNALLLTIDKISAGIGKTFGWTIIILTLGIGLLIVNGVILYLLPIVVNYIDFLRGSIIIQDIPALVYATLILTAVNFIVHIAA